MINLLENTRNQPSIKSTYNINTQIKFRTSMLRSSLCDYSDAYIPVSATITVPKTPAAGAASNNKKYNNQKLCFIY